MDAVEKLSGTLGGSGSMAGDDTGGQAWAEQYDAAAGPLLRAGCQVGEALAQLANLVAKAARVTDGLKGLLSAAHRPGDRQDHRCLPVTPVPLRGDR